MAEWVKKLEENAKGFIAEAEQELTALEGVDTVDLTADDAADPDSGDSNSGDSDSGDSDSGDSVEGTEKVTSDEGREQISD